MPSDATPSSARRWIKRLLLAATAVVLLLIVAFVIFRVVNDRRVDAELARIRAAGHPVTPAELDAWYDRTGDAPDPSPMYIAALPEFQTLESRDYPQLPVFGEPDFPWTEEQERAALASAEQAPSEADVPEDPYGDYSAYGGYGRADGSLPADWREQAQALLATYAEPLETIREASTMGPARFDIDLSQGIDTLLPHLGQLRTAAKLLALSAGLHYRAGETDAALDEVATMLGLAESLDREPVLISTLVSLSMRQLAVLTLRDMIAAGKLSAEDLQRASDMLHAELPGAVFERAMIGERAMGNDFFLQNSSAAQQIPNRGISAMRAIGLLDLDHLVYLKTMQQTVDAAGRLDEIDRSDIQKLDLAMEDLPAYALISGIVLPALSASFEAVLRHHAAQRLIRAAALVERHRQLTGDWPADVAALGDVKWPIDPLDGQPLRYRIDDDRGVRLWSVGLDGTNDGGVAPQRAFRDEPGEDLVVTLPAAGASHGG